MIYFRLKERVLSWAANYYIFYSRAAQIVYFKGVENNFLCICLMFLIIQIPPLRNTFF
jgi:hypothetical protein